MPMVPPGTKSRTRLSVTSKQVANRITWENVEDPGMMAFLDIFSRYRHDPQKGVGADLQTNRKGGATTRSRRKVNSFFEHYFPAVTIGSGHLAGK
jgi:hypothetical protein